MMMKNVLTTLLATFLIAHTTITYSKQIELKTAQQLITLTALPQKIIVMNFGALDTLDALGANKVIIGLPQNNTPSYLAKYRGKQYINAGGMKTPDLEAIRKAKPDLIISDPRQKSQHEALEKIAPTLHLHIDAKTFWSSVSEQTKLLGKVAGQSVLANQQLNALQQKITLLQEKIKTANKKVVLALHNNGKVMLTSHGNNASLLFDLLALIPIKPKPTIKKEIKSTQDKKTNRPKPVIIDNDFIQHYKPDLILIVDRSQAIGQPAMSNEHFNKQLLASTNTRIVKLTADLWYLSGGGLESLNKQLDEIDHILK